MGVLDSAKRHFQTRRDLKGPILVPEWGGDETTPVEIYYQIPNMQTRSEMVRALNEGGLEGVVTILLLMALDAEGKHMFAKAHRAELMRSVDPEVIQRITSEMDVTGPDAGE